MEYENNNQLKLEVKEFMREKDFDYTEENFLIYYGFAQNQIKGETYWTPCENCDNPNCTTLELKLWYCKDQM